MSKRIEIVCEPIPDDLGGGWHAFVIGQEYYLLGDGETPSEAVANLSGVMRDDEKRKDER